MGHALSGLWFRVSAPGLTMPEAHSVVSRADFCRGKPLSPMGGWHVETTQPNTPDALAQWSPALLASETGFVDSFSTDGVGAGWMLQAVM